MKIAETLFIRS